MLSFHLSINVIIIVASFKILDLCPIALFQQLWNTLYGLFSNVVCYERSMLWTGLLWTWSVMNQSHHQAPQIVTWNTINQ